MAPVRVGVVRWGEGMVGGKRVGVGALEREGELRGGAVGAGGLRVFGLPFC